MHQQRINAALAALHKQQDDLRIARTYPKGSVIPAEYQRTELRNFLMKGESRTGLGESAGNIGGFFVPVEFDFTRDILQAQKQYDAMLDENVVRIIESQDGNMRPHPLPAVDYTSVSASIVSESTQATASTVPTAAQIMLSKPSFNYRGNALPITLEMAQDSYEDVTEILSQVFGISIARGVGADLVNGDGVNAPQGILTAASLGATSAAAGVIAATDLEAVYKSLNRAYRINASWLMNDNTYLSVRGLTDSNGRPLLSIRDDQELLLGKPIRISPAMPDVSAGSKSILLAALKQYAVKRSPFRLTRATEVPGYVEYGTVLFNAWQRFDGRLLNPGTAKPAVYLQQHA